MARLASAIARNRRFLSDAVTPSPRGGGLLVSTRSSLAGVDRAHANRLRARWLLARLVDAGGLSAPGFAASRFGHRRWLRRLHTSHCLPAGRQPLWPQPLGFGAASSLFARLQRRLVFVGAGSAMSGGDSRRGSVRLRRPVAGR